MGPTKKCFFQFYLKNEKKYIKKKNFFRSIFAAFFAQRGVFPLASLSRGQFLDCMDAVCCVCFRVVILVPLSPYFFRFLPHFSKKLRFVPVICFFEKEKNEKGERVDDAGSHIVVAPDREKKEEKSKLHVFGLKNTNNKKG